MKLALAVLLLLAGPALGQATYSANYNAAEVAALTTERPTYNAAICAKFGIPAGCTQGAARNAFCVSVGLASNCTYSAARDAYCARNSALGNAPCSGVPVVVIASNNDELFAAKAQEGIDKTRTAQREAGAQSFCGPGGIWRTMTKAQKDATCAATTPPQPAGCNLCR